MKIQVFILHCCLPDGDVPLFFPLTIIGCPELTKLNTSHFERAHLTMEKTAALWSRNKFSQKWNKSNHELIRYGSEPRKGFFWGQFHRMHIWIIKSEGCEGCQRRPGVQMQHRPLRTHHQSVPCLQVHCSGPSSRCAITDSVELRWHGPGPSINCKKKILFDP